MHLKFAEDSFVTHNFKTQLSEFDTIEYDSDITFHCETWSFSQGISVYCCKAGVKLMNIGRPT